MRTCVIGFDRRNPHPRSCTGHLDATPSSRSCAPSLDCLSVGRLLQYAGRPSSSRHHPSVAASPLRSWTGLSRTQERMNIATRRTGWSFCLTGPRVHLQDRSREITESNSAMGDIDRSGIPQSHSPERGAPWSQITVGAHSRSPRHREACASSSRRRCLCNGKDPVSLLSPLSHWVCSDEAVPLDGPSA